MTLSIDLLDLLKAELEEMNAEQTALDMRLAAIKLLLRDDIPAATFTAEQAQEHNAKPIGEKYPDDHPVMVELRKREKGIADRSRFCESALTQEGETNNASRRTL